MILRSHIDLSLFALVFHLKEEQIPSSLRAYLSDTYDGPRTLREVINILFQDEKLRLRYFHEYYHFWQAIRLPYIYFYAIKSFKSVFEFFTNYGPILHGNARQRFKEGAVPELRILSFKRKVYLL